MRSTTRALAAAALAALLLTGCTSTPAGSGPAPDAADPAAASAPADRDNAAARGNVEPIVTGVWAGEKYDQFLASMEDRCGELTGMAELRACAPEEPFSYLTEIRSPAPGELVVTLSPEAWGGGPYDPERVYTLDYVADNMSLHIAKQSRDLDTLTATTPTGSHEYTQERLPHYASYYDPAGNQR